VAEEKAALERRKQTLEANRSNRQKEKSANMDEDDGALERLLADLRNGETITRKARRRRPGGSAAATSTLELDLTVTSNDTSFNARDMLARLQSDGFVAPPSPTSNAHQRRRRRRTDKFEEKDIPTSPLATEILDMSESGPTDTEEVLST